MKSFSQFSESSDFRAVVHYTTPEGEKKVEEVRHPMNPRTGAHEFVGKLPKGSKVVKVDYPLD
jgi:hypothetical protein